MQLQSSDHSYSLKAFYERLFHVCQNDIACFEGSRSSVSESQAQHARALARELGLLKNSTFCWNEFRKETSDLHFGTEHAVELAPLYHLVVKITIPPGFGLIPAVVRHPILNLREAREHAKFRNALEFISATPMEYIARWILCRPDEELSKLLKIYPE